MGFFALWAEPARAAAFGLQDWDRIVRIARGAKLLGALQARIESSGAWDAVPESAAAMLIAARYETDFLARMVHSTAERVAEVLAPIGAPVILLKGAGYLAQALPLAKGRKVSDVDILVPKGAIGEAERRLIAAGWEAPDLDPYDDRYYREWSHELPPMRYPDQPLELDLHHQILPPTGRIHPDVQALLTASVPVPGLALRTLCPADQVLHAAAHTFQDSDCVNRLRDVADVDALIRSFAPMSGFVGSLVARAEVHGMSAPLAYALIQACRFFATPLPLELAQWVSARERGIGSFIMNRLFERVLAPVDPDRLPRVGLRAARFVLLCRYHFLRMPLGLLIRHSVSKAVRRWRDTRQVRSNVAEGVPAS